MDIIYHKTHRKILTIFSKVNEREIHILRTMFYQKTRKKETSLIRRHGFIPP